MDIQIRSSDIHNSIYVDIHYYVWFSHTHNLIEKES